MGSDFNVDDKVSFVSNSGKELVGVIVKINPKTYKIKIVTKEATQIAEAEYQNRWVTRHSLKHKLTKI